MWSTDRSAAQERLYDFEGYLTRDDFGFSVDGIGDINHDGHDDMIVGAAFANTSNGVDSGSARVLSGKDGSVLFEFLGDSAGDYFGGSVASAGDVDDDGHPDMIVGAPLDDDFGNDSGSARVFSGKDGSIIHTFYGDTSPDHFGISVSGAGDVNLDGYADVIVGAPHDGGFHGTATVFSGKDGSTIWQFTGPTINDRLGQSVSGAGFVDNDLYPDLIAGAVNDDTQGSVRGAAYVYSGQTGNIIGRFYGDSLDDAFGWSVSEAGDVNNDGRDDLIVGARYDDNTGTSSGMARVFSGLNGSVLYSIDGDGVGSGFGDCVADAGDINKDGYDDFIVGAPSGYESVFTEPGYVRVYSGKDGSVLFDVEGDDNNDWFGFSVACAGDVNNDTFPDFIVGAQNDDPNGQFSGSARVLSGANPWSIGQSCTQPPCNNCPSMNATTSGPPTLGNLTFALELLSAPSNATYAILAVSDPCVSPGVPWIACDTVKVPLSALQVVSIPFVNGAPPCGTAVSALVGIPNQVVYLGVELGFQWAVSCTASTLGTSISNCASFVVTN